MSYIISLISLILKMHVIYKWIVFEMNWNDVMRWSLVPYSMRCLTYTMWSGMNCHLLVVWSGIRCPILVAWFRIGCLILTGWSDMGCHLIVVWSDIWRHVMRDEIDDKLLLHWDYSAQLQLIKRLVRRHSHTIRKLNKAILMHKKTSK